MNRLLIALLFLATSTPLLRAAEGDTMHTDFIVPGLGGGLSLVRTWSSLMPLKAPRNATGLFGHSWRSNFEEKLERVRFGDDEETIRYWRGDGSVWRFRFYPGVGYDLVNAGSPPASLKYDSSTREFRVCYRDGSVHVFNHSGTLTALQDRNGNSTTLNYDEAGRLVTVNASSGKSITFEYKNGSKLVARVSDETGTLASYTYNGGESLVHVSYPDDTGLSYTYDTNRLLRNVMDARGGVVESYTYDSAHHRDTRSQGGLTHLDRRSPTQSPLKPGLAATYIRDADGNVTTIRRLLSDGQAQVWNYTYNRFGELLTATDPLGHTTTNTYDDHGNLLSTTLPAPDANTPGSTTAYSYDLKGQLTTITDPLGHTTTLRYTPAGMIRSSTNAQHKTSRYEYDQRNTLVAAIGPDNRRTTFERDARGRVTKVTYSDSTFVQYGYDHRGRRTMTTAPERSHHLLYDTANRLISATDGAAHETQYHYDASNHLVSVTDALNRTTRFTYDTLDRLINIEFPTHRSESFTYDDAGNLLTKTDRSGNTLTYSYDSLNRLIRKSYPDGTAVQYTYDIANRLLSVSDATGTYSFTYDNQGRMVGSTVQYGFLRGRSFTSTYVFDAASRRRSYTSPAAETVTYDYDELNQLTALTSSVAGRFEFGYDSQGRRNSVLRPNGVVSSYVYDSDLHLLSVLHQINGTPQDGVVYNLDANGSRTGALNYLDNSRETYSYDSTAQLVAVKRGGLLAEQYEYDGVGNRLSSIALGTYRYNELNELLSTEHAQYRYDDNGNLVTKSEPGKGTTSYSWDFDGRLVRITQPSRDIVTFKYDPFGRRILKSGPKGSVIYIYDGPNVVGEYDGAGRALATYTQSPDVDQPLAIRANNSLAFYNHDALGSISSLSDTSGQLVASYRTDLFGNTTSATGTLPNPYRYTGRELDEDTGLYYYRARYYDPQIGRFISEDPVRWQGGINFYAYVGNQPLLFNDPFGHQSSAGGYTLRVTRDCFDAVNGIRHIDYALYQNGQPVDANVQQFWITEQLTNTQLAQPWGQSTSDKPNEFLDSLGQLSLTPVTETVTSRQYFLVSPDRYSLQSAFWVPIEHVSGSQCKKNMAQGIYWRRDGGADSVVSLVNGSPAPSTCNGVSIF